ncbi:hypothetical protein Srufu_019140 [Streptomyces libani subsp. rufus]|nr:hypothetical protein Srufu_019140 [Streptomyces libani subsp. rufus]
MTAQGNFSRVPSHGTQTEVTDSAHTMLERLRAVDWSDDSTAFDHANSRALLMREYLRRSALWACAYGAEQSWPFFDIAEHVAAELETPPDVAAEVEEVLAGLAPLR